MNRPSTELAYSLRNLLRNLMNRPNCTIAQFAQRIKAYFFRVAQFALRIYKAICVFAICLSKCCNFAFVKAIVLKENLKINRN